MKPRLLPQRDKAWVLAEAEKTGEIDTSKPFVMGFRGYFRDSMGKVGENDRGIYDDAIFVVSPKEFRSFWGNTDPSGYRKGYGEGANKGMACLEPGVWEYKRGMHRGKYMALVQRVEPVVVKRDGNPDYLDEGMHGINIHNGAWKSTSSLGCQTIYPSLWQDFYDMVDRLMDEYDMPTIKYGLVEKQG